MTGTGLHGFLMDEGCARSNGCWNACGRITGRYPSIAEPPGETQGHSRFRERDRNLLPRHRMDFQNDIEPAPQQRKRCPAGYRLPLENAHILRSLARGNHAGPGGYAYKTVAREGIDRRACRATPATRDSKGLDGDRTVKRFKSRIGYGCSIDADKENGLLEECRRLLCCHGSERTCCSGISTIEQIVRSVDGLRFDPSGAFHVELQ